MLTPKTLLVGPTFSGGGAERRFTNIARYLFGGCSDVAILTAAKSKEDQPQNQVIDLGWRGKFTYPAVIWRLARQIRKQKYDVIMSFGLFPNLVSIIAFKIAGGDTRLVINEITRPEMVEKLGGSRSYNILRRVFYPRSTLITANSIDGLVETCRLAKKPLESGLRVVNVMDSSCNEMKAKDTDSLDDAIPAKPYVVFIGRLESLKRVDTLIDAFSQLVGRTDSQLVIIGDGEMRAALESQVDRLNLGNTVHFTGRLDNPFPILAKASAFVLASEYEGFSNSLLEAMFLDVPVITSFCSSDAREMCSKGAALGFEVGDSTRLAKQIFDVTNDKALSDELLRSAREYRTPHVLENAIPFYEDLIRKVVTPHGTQYGSSSAL